MRIFHTSTLCLFLLLPVHFLLAQPGECPVPENENVVSLSGNFISAPVVPGPYNFFSSEDFSSYRIYNGPNSPVTIFAQNLWLGGTDVAGNIKLSAATYNERNNNRLPSGPLNDDGTVFAQGCDDFDRIWEVRLHEIDLHLADFADNGTIDDPITNVVGWPGAGNAQFSSIYGFELPDEESLAPFADLDNDGIYEPLDGEYPVEPFSGAIAAHMTWEVYHTLNATISGEPEINLPAEVHHTQWAFYCQEDGLLNTSVFSRYTIENKGVEDIVDFKAGVWTDFDLGCFTDDYIGSDTIRNTFFSYNRDNDDDLICEQGVPAFGLNPPTQSTVILNQDLFAFNTLLNGGVGSPPVQLIDPNTSEQHLNRLNGLLNDGTPFKNEGLGLSGGDDTPFFWPGNPNNIGEWSAFDIDINPLDFRALGVVDFGRFEPGERLTIDLAHTFHRAEGNDHLENVELLYQEVDEIQALYDNGFNATCTPVICNDDCVWPGDLNNDGIANYVDLVALGFGYDSVGPTRDLPIFWAPTIGDTWGGEQVFELAPDLKHLDGNDDGQVDAEDFGQTIDFYNFTRPDFVPQDFTTDGSDVRFTSPNGEPFGPIAPGAFRVGYIRVNSPFADLRAVTMEVEYDTAHLSQFEPIGNDLSDPELLLFGRDADMTAAEIAAYVEEPAMELNEDYELIRVSIRINPEPPSASTTVRFKNIRGWLADGTEVSLGGMDSEIAINLPNSVGEPQWASGIEIFPNPAKDIINIRSGDIQLDRVEVMDHLGRVVMELEDYGQIVDVSRLPGGMYKLRLIAGNESISRKIIISE